MYFSYIEDETNLEELLWKDKGKMSEDFVWHCMIQIAEALAYLREYMAPKQTSLSFRSSLNELQKDCHLELSAELTTFNFTDYGYNRARENPDLPEHNWRQVIHGDVKLSNILVGKRRYVAELPPLFLSGFELAVLHPDNKGASAPWWQGSEWPSRNIKTDVWGLGTIIHVLCLRRMPIPYNIGNLNPTDPGNHRSKVPQSVTPAGYSHKLDCQMMDCFVRDPNGRIGSKALFLALQQHHSHSGA